MSNVKEERGLISNIYLAVTSVVNVMVNSIAVAEKAIEIADNKIEETSKLSKLATMGNTLSEVEKLEAKHGDLKELKVKHKEALELLDF